MNGHSIYAVYTQVCSLTDTPLRGDGIREPFLPLFAAADCYRQILSSDTLPFIRNLGPLHLDLRRAAFWNSRLGRGSDALAAYLGGRSVPRWEREGQRFYAERSGPFHFFGYNRRFPDQRFNCLPLSLKRPLFIRASEGGKSAAQGRVFVHLYPFGVLVIHAAVSLLRRYDSADALAADAHRTHPARAAADGWVWSSRLGSGRLGQILERCKRSLSESLLEAPRDLPWSGWHLAYKLLSSAQPEEWHGTLLRDSVGRMDQLLNEPWRRYDWDAHEAEYPYGNYEDQAASNYLLFYPSGFLYCMSRVRPSGSYLNQFWKIHRLFELGLVKNSLYGTLSESLTHQILPSLQRSKEAGPDMGESLGHLERYRLELQALLRGLDRITGGAGGKSFYKKVYSELAGAVRMDGRRKKVKALMKELNRAITSEANVSERKDKILFVSADPSDASRLGIQLELRKITEELDRSAGRERFVFETSLAARASDLSRSLLARPRPRVLHFSGHGTKAGAICLEDDAGRVQPVSGAAIGSLLAPISDRLECVVLNACYARKQAEAILNHVRYVVAMSDAIADRAAIAYSVGFYQAVFNGEPIPVAHRLGCAQVQMVVEGEHEKPELLTAPGPEKE